MPFPFGPKGSFTGSPGYFHPYTVRCILDQARMSQSLKIASTLHIEDPYPSTGQVSSSGAEPLNSAGVPGPKPPSAFVVQPPPQFGTMEAAAVVTLVALVMAMAGVSRALHIQGNLDKDDVLPSSEEILGDHLLRLVRP